MKTLFSYNKNIARFKHIEVCCHFFSPKVVIDFHFSIRRKSDHPGIFFSIMVLGCTVEASLYDSRHWDHENNCFEAYNGEK